MTTDENILSDLEYLPPFGKSDHLVLKSSLHLFTTNPPKCTNKTFKQINYHDLNRDLEKIDWRNLLVGNVESMWGAFMEVLNSSMSTNTSIKTSRRNPLKPCIGRDILQMIRHKKALWQKYRRHLRSQDYENHRIFSRELKSMLKSAKRQFEDKIASSRDRKKFYKFVRSTIKTKVSTPRIRRADGTLCELHQESAEVFADSFEASFSQEPDGPMPGLGIPRCVPTFDFVEISQDMVLRHLSVLKDSSPGRDGLSPAILRRCASSLALPLSLIYQESLRSHCLPSSWVSASVTPIYKKGDSESAANYRPISLTSVPCKVLERIIQEQLLKFALENGLIPPAQHGFVPGRSIAFLRE
ncbi:uncharacterized protein LOC123322877 [Coccinella septempunctata]|uniref:uncharacterized protein LOC123322877 n=1 Tax=Coccinella septempunctata TaxID=41139 RepID=UPI001D07FBDF|nr:uncharacterized protein LOC123322877 [Coccinella septempunctata]